jgi:hypothetical protein
MGHRKFGSLIIIGAGYDMTLLSHGSVTDDPARSREE